MSDEAKTFPNLERACGGEIRLARLIQIKATLARQPDAVQAEFLEFMRLSREMFAPVDGNATNATLREMPEFSDEMIRRQMTLCFASVGGFVMYADILRQGTKPSYPDGIGAIIQLGRALDRRIALKA